LHDISAALLIEKKRKEKKDYAFWRLFNEKPSIIPGCPDTADTWSWQ